MTAHDRYKFDARIAPLAASLATSSYLLALLMGSCFGLGCSEDTPQPADMVASAGGSAGASSSGGMGGSGGQPQDSGGSGGAMQAGAGGSGGASGAAGAGGAGGSSGAGGGVAGAGGASGGNGGAGGDRGGEGGAAGGTDVADFQLYGRWDASQAGRAVTVNSGSHITATFNGTGISAMFDISGNTGARPTVSFRIDGGELQEEEISATLELASGLSPGEHDVLLFVRGMSEFEPRWTPPLVSSTVFVGFTVQGGELVPQPRPMRTKIEFLGDSITEGVRVHDQGPAGQTGANWLTDGARNYAALTAQKLGYEWRQVGFGRQGLTIGGNGGVPTAQESFDFFYAGVERDDWQADIVVINQGTNDGATNGAAFATLYRSYLSLLRSGYPQAKIVAMRPLIGSFGSEIEAEVNALRAGGDDKVFYVDTAGWTNGGDFSDGIHPNLAGSEKISDALVTALEALPD